MMLRGAHREGLTGFFPDPDHDLDDLDEYHRREIRNAADNAGGEIECPGYYWRFYLR